MRNSRLSAACGSRFRLSFPITACQRQGGEAIRENAEDIAATRSRFKCGRRAEVHAPSPNLSRITLELRDRGIARFFQAGNSYPRFHIRISTDAFTVDFSRTRRDRVHRRARLEGACGRVKCEISNPRAIASLATPFQIRSHSFRQIAGYSSSRSSRARSS